MDDANLNPLRSLTIDPALLKATSNKDFSINRHPTLPLAIFNYTNRFSLLSKAWGNLGLAARGLVVETTTGNVVSRGLPKFFNYHEKFAYKPTGNEYAFAIEEKVDGSLITLFWYRGDWMMISRSAFDSPHALAARRILDSKYPGALRKLDKEKTYVFELVDPALPVKVIYKKEDLVILTIVSRDGSEPPYDFDWTTLPFSRPRKHSAPTVIPKQLRTLNLLNEEGFVVKFWSSLEDRYPKRIKVKFESYLIGGPQISSGGVSDAISKLSISSSPQAPSNARVLEIYTKNRLKIQHFKSTEVSNIMGKHRCNTLQSLEEIADDYGGEPWLESIGKIWDRIDAIFTLQEAEFKETISSLQQEGYKPNLANAKASDIRSRFERRIKKNDIDRGFKDVLLSWYLAWPAFRQVACFVEQVEIPQDLRSTEVIGIIMES